MIYFLLNKHDNKIKIGYSKNADNIKERVVSHRVGNHNPLTLVKVIKGTLKEESELHYKFSFYHVSGEWFEYAPEIQIFIKSKKGIDKQKIDYKSFYNHFDRKSIEEKIIKLRKSGLKLQSIADKLNSDGVNSFHGGIWRHTSVRNTLLRHGLK